MVQPCTPSLLEWLIIIEETSLLKYFLALHWEANQSKSLVRKSWRAYISGFSLCKPLFLNKNMEATS